ncbi:uncharacterized protein LOC125603677, partial [Brassica napus]|uniref:uncharacterized protein LOC125603677 n=1 Tax=Brassica napus TaxID=3708 RepID=UPI002078EED4
EQEQNQEDSGHHNQEDDAQSSGDGQGESTGSGESVAQSTGSDESVAQSTGSEESGAQSSEGHLMESNDFSREMKTRSSYQVKKGRENEWIWSDWVKTVFGSCGIWSNQIKEEPLKELVIFEDEAVQEITRKSGIEAASEERSKLVKGSEDKRVIRDWKQGKDELYQLVGRLKEVWLKLTARPEVIQERREQDVIFNFLVNEMCELVQYICDVCEKNKKSIQWKGVTNCKKGRLRKLSKVWFMRRKAWRKDSESGYLSDKMSLKMIKEAAQLVVRGECEQEQNQEDSGHHNQEDDAQSSGDGQGESTGSGESVAQSTGSDESVAQSTGSEESGAQSSEGEQEQNQEDSGHHNQEDDAQSSGDGQGESTGSGESGLSLLVQMRVWLSPLVQRRVELSLVK